MDEPLKTFGLKLNAWGDLFQRLLVRSIVIEGFERGSKRLDIGIFGKRGAV